MTTNQQQQILIALETHKGILPSWILAIQDIIDKFENPFSKYFVFYTNVNLIMEIRVDGHRIHYCDVSNYINVLRDKDTLTIFHETDYLAYCFVGDSFIVMNNDNWRAT